MIKSNILDRTTIFNINNYYDEYDYFHAKDASLLNFRKEESKYDIIKLETKSKKSKFLNILIYI